MLVSEERRSCGNLVDLPSHWTCLALKYALREGKEGTKIGPFGSSLRLDTLGASGLKVFGQENVISADFHRGHRHVPINRSEDFRQYEVSPGDLLVTMMGTAGRCELVPVDAPEGILDSHLLRLRVRPDVLEPRFLRWFLNDSAWADAQVDLMGNGSIMQGLNSSIVRNLQIGLPPLREQRRIAAFLDLETHRIDELVKEQERLLELLHEHTHAAVLNAVSGGSPNAENLANHWSVGAPRHWNRVALRHVSVARCDGPFGASLKSEHYTERGTRVVRLQNIRRRSFDGRDEAYIDSSYAKSLSHHDVRAGDLLIAGLGDDNNVVGRACTAPPDLGPAIVKADCFRFRLDTGRAEPRFVAAQLSATADEDARLLASGSTRSRVSLSRMASRVLVLPPLSEQQKIMDAIDEIDSYSAGLSAAAEDAMALLRERRSALITAAVTGQIDVRDWHPTDEPPIELQREASP